MPYPAQTDQKTIVETARMLIERQGVEGVSLALVASELGIKAPSLYRYVTSKNALLQEVVTLTFRQLFQAYDEALQEAGADPEGRMLAICRAHRRFAHAHPETYLLAFTTTRPEQRADERVLEEMVLPVQEIMAAIAGKEQSLPALRGALALIHGFVMLELKEQLRRGGDLSQAFEASVAAYIRGWQQHEQP